MYIRILFLLAAAAASLLRADTLTFTVTPVDGEFFYQFTLSNTGATGGTLFDLFLSLPNGIATIDTTTIGMPVGWGDATGGLLFFGPNVSPSTSFIEWAADFSGAHDAGIGSSLSGFSFNAVQPAGTPIQFAVNGTIAFSTAQEVTAVPEPGRFTMLIALIAAIGFGVRYRRVT
jgi:hypothetical protein